ncbi:hypothetical protein, conserved [Trypanosoma brucei gambiense DAL972]|uniref:Guanine nucleotide-binding protein subunit beta-like protein n=2 Tax=Trypanosoma brucei TaxID=5691 RepID=D0A8Q7_TRYB9|nr:hypothetical protein, conserved [Trypanosoma brucei gambiense DAL972]RHW67536.1 hypothetical protein DPX39_110080100 [Trypanosoma brucei equiperdum]CBH18058.1 hypothetical protein, conserved [Trypanosoma brucei gambiense DAL972]|eukprot:XP_011780322.1 hypothetical protein, conserved [Trypanosoma brucei gambiense DAL972]
MTSRKRPREAATYHDIRLMCQHAREREALLRTGPFFVERILAPRLVGIHYRVDGLLTDPSRLSRDNEVRAPLKWRQRCQGLLALPQHAQVEGLKRHFGSMNVDDFRTVIPSPVYVATRGERSGINVAVRALAPVTDVVFDMEEQFAVVCQRRRFSTYAISSWMESLDVPSIPGAAVPLVSVEPQGFSSLGFALSALQFLSSSLHVIAGYHRAPVVDIFDLENVDEETSEPQQRFNLTDVKENGNVEDGSSAYANDVMPMDRYVSLGALSSGLSVWLDSRSGKAEACTGVLTRQYTIGAHNPHTGRRDPLACVTSLCQGNPANILLGTEAGALQLWDVRCTRECVAQHMTSASICRLHPSYSYPLRNVVWLNTLAGCVEAVSVGQSDMELLARRLCPDFQRSSSTFHLPPPRLSLMESSGVVACPHISSGKLLLYDGSSLVKQPNNSRTQLSSYNRGVDGKDNEYENGHCSNFGGFLREASSSSEESGEREIPLLNALPSEANALVTACTVWSNRDMFVLGDETGRVQLL